MIPPPWKIYFTYSHFLNSVLLIMYTLTWNLVIPSVIARIKKLVVIFRCTNTWNWCMRRRSDAERHTYMYILIICDLKLLSTFLCRHCRDNHEFSTIDTLFLQCRQWYSFKYPRRTGFNSWNLPFSRLKTLSFGINTSKNSLGSISNCYHMQLHLCQTVREVWNRGFSLKIP